MSRFERTSRTPRTGRLAATRVLLLIVDSARFAMKFPSARFDSEAGTSRCRDMS